MYQAVGAYHVKRLFCCGKTWSIDHKKYQRVLYVQAGSSESQEVSLLREQITVLAEELDSREHIDSEFRTNNEANEALEVDLQVCLHIKLLNSKTCFLGPTLMHEQSL